MKKRRKWFVALPLAVVMMLSGCFLYDESVGDNIGQFVDPANIAGDVFLPESNAEKKPDDIPLNSAANDPEDDYGIIVISENHTRYTNPAVIEVSRENGLAYYYEGDHFRVWIPFLWRKTMVVDVIVETDEHDNELRYYNFYYVPEGQYANPPKEAAVMTIRVVTQEYFSLNGHGQDGISALNDGFDEDGFFYYTFLMPSEEQQLPSDFPDADGYVNIQKVLSANWDFQPVLDD